MTQEQALTTVTPAVNGIDFRNSHNELISFVAKQLREAKNISKGDPGDYGIIPGTKKKTLLKPGAEKLAKFFGLVPSYEKIKEIEDFDKGFVFYKYRCILTHFSTGKSAGDAIRSSNNKESSFIRQGKSVYELSNNVEAKAQKRALVAAVVQATMASEIFDADISENEEEAPNRSITKEEDPRRNQLTMRLYGTAKEHGWTDEWIHTAIKKKWMVPSLTNLSNEQIEELTEFIVTKYSPVEKGQKPVLRELPKAVTIEAKDDVQEAQIVIEQKKQEEEEKKEDVRKCAAQIATDCLINIPEGYTFAECSKCRFEAFLEEGRQKKAAEEAQARLL
jgi:hypothetical protein